MNYIWEFLLKAEEQHIGKDKIVFRPAKSYSPYMEMALDTLNIIKLEKGEEIEINPYYRFYNIFKDVFNINIKDDLELREILFNIIVRLLGENDLKSGLCKGEYNKKFLIRDFETGVFGERAKCAMELLTTKEKDKIITSMVLIYRFGSNLEVIKDVIKSIFVNSIIYINNENATEILVYLGVKNDEKEKEKINLIVDIFARLDYKICLYWEQHFGILGVEETMELGEIVMY